MPVQNAAKKKGILSLSPPPLALRHGGAKDAATLSAQSRKSNGVNSFWPEP